MMKNTPRATGWTRSPSDLQNESDKLKVILITKGQGHSPQHPSDLNKFKLAVPADHKVSKKIEFFYRHSHKN